MKVAAIFLQITEVVPNLFYFASIYTKSLEFSDYRASILFALNALDIACGKIGNKVCKCVRFAMSPMRNNEYGKMNWST